MIKRRYLIGLALLGSLAGFGGLASVQVQANEATNSPMQGKQQTGCTPLREVVTGETRIRKQIKVDPFGSGNFNTDFAVPSGQGFSYFIVNFAPENDATYEVAINFKYSDGTFSTVLDARGPAQRNETYSRRFISPTGQEPYQVNTRIGGPNNTAYTVSVEACR